MKQKSHRLTNSENHFHRTLIRRLDASKLTEILEKCYGISKISIWGEPTDFKTPEKIFEYASSVLEHYGLVAPYKKIRPLNTYSNSYFNFKKACIADLAMLTYFAYSTPADEVCYFPLDDLNFSTGLKGRVKELEISRIGYMLGLHRFSNEKDKNSNNSELPYALYASDSENGEYTVYSRNLSHKQHQINNLCIPLVDTLVQCYKKNPLIIMDYESKINSNAPHWQEDTNELLTIKINGKDIPILEALNDKYADLFKEISKYTTPIRKELETAENKITQNSLRNYYARHMKALKKYCKQPLKEGSNNDAEYEHALQVSLYLTEYLFGFKYCDNLRELDNLPTDKYTLEATQFLADFPYCNTRIQYLRLYNQLQNTEYSYDGRIYKSNNSLTKHIYKNMIYTWETYMPALLYCFMFLYRKYATSNSIIEEFIKSHQTSDFDYTINHNSVFKNERVISFYKGKLRNNYSLYPSCVAEPDISKPRGKQYNKLDKLEYKLIKIPKNIF